MQSSIFRIAVLGLAITLAIVGLLVSALGHGFSNGWARAALVVVCLGVIVTGGTLLIGYALGRVNMSLIAILIAATGSVGFVIMLVAVIQTMLSRHGH